MLRTTATAHPIDAALAAYVNDTLGVAIKTGAWAGERRLPYLLRSTFAVRESRIFDRTILLALDREPERPALSTVRAAIDQMQILSGESCVYVTLALASYERKRLIEQKVPFIVPGNQLYLPDLGIDLRQYFRTRAHPAEASLSPATQALLISVLLHEPWQEEWQPAQMIADLGYTPMTLSRAVKELTAAGIATLHYRGRVRWLRMTRAPAQTWQHALPRLVNPVKRRFWAAASAALPLARIRLAGVSALARHELIAPPQWPVYALSHQEWKAATQAGLESLPDTLTDSCEWQVWNYSPSLTAGSATVDLLSLTLSFADASDERVSRALDRLPKLLPW